MNSRRIKHIIIANSFINNGNRGCVALTYSILYFINTLSQEEHWEYKIYLTDSGIPGFRSSSQKIKIASQNITIYTIPHFLPATVKHLFFFITHPYYWFQTIKLYKQTDCVLDIGFGDSFSDIYGIERFTTIDLIHRECRLLHIPYSFLPQTIGPFYSKDIERKAINSLALASYIMTRDKLSFDYISTIKNLKKKVLTIDLAFFLPYNQLYFDKSKTHVGLNISALLWNNGYTGNNEFNLKDDYKTIIHSIIRKFLEYPDVIIHLTPHVVHSEHHIENDYEISSQLYYEYHSSKLLLSPLFLTPIEAKNYIAGMDFFIGSRMHSTIAAFSTNVPLVALSYSRKFEGLFNETLGYKHVVNLKDLTLKEIINTILESFTQRNNYKTIIENINSTTVSQEKNHILSTLSKILKSNGNS